MTLEILLKLRGTGTDRAGHILAARLVRSGMDLRNIFPRNEHFNIGAWRTVEDHVYKTVLSDGEVSQIHC